MAYWYIGIFVNDERQHINMDYRWGYEGPGPLTAFGRRFRGGPDPKAIFQGTFVVTPMWHRPGTTVHEVTFDMNFGRFPYGSAPRLVADRQYVYTGSTINPPQDRNTHQVFPPPMREGYTFQYWYTILNGVETPWNFSVPLADNMHFQTPTRVAMHPRHIELRAKFTPN